MCFRRCRDTRQSNQLANRFAVEENRDRAAGEVGKLVAVVDAEVMVDRGEQVLRVEKAFGEDFGFGVGVGGSDGLCCRVFRQFDLSSSVISLTWSGRTSVTRGLVSN